MKHTHYQSAEVVGFSQQIKNVSEFPFENLRRQTLKIVNVEPVLKESFPTEPPVKINTRPPICMPRSVSHELDPLPTPQQSGRKTRQRIEEL